jgi:hypothetical protein
MVEAKNHRKPVVATLLATQLDGEDANLCFIAK